MIVCLGTTPALSRTMEFDGLSVDGVNRAMRVFEYAAGKAVNAARAAKNLGEAATSVSPVGGATGDRFRTAAESEYAADGTLLHEFVLVNAPTRLCVTAIDRQAGTSTELIENAAAMREEEATALFQEMANRLNAETVLVLSGSLAPGIDDAYYGRCIEHAHAVGTRVVVDASGAPLRHAIERRPDVVKINANELAGLVGPIAVEDDPAILTAARSLAGKTRGFVMVTRGRRSTLAAHANGWAASASVPTVEVTSAIGSGDSFAAGVAVGLARNLPMIDAMTLATAAASANAMTADAAHFDRDVVERLAATIVVTPVA